MTNKSLLECFTLLSTMNCGREQTWSDRLRPVYALVLRKLEDELGKAAVEYAVLHEEWRPAPARLLEIAAELASPIPDAEMCYSEVVHEAQEQGLFAMPLPENPNIKLEGPPPFSHPIIAQIVRYCGGWKYICAGDANMAEGLKKQVRGSHESISRQWKEEVKRQVILPPGKRNHGMFPVYVAPTILPPVLVPLMLEAPKEYPQIAASEMPDEVRAAIAKIGQIKDPPKSSRLKQVIEDRGRRNGLAPLTSADRARINAELRAHGVREEEVPDPFPPVTLDPADWRWQYTDEAVAWLEARDAEKAKERG